MNVCHLSWPEVSAPGGRPRLRLRKISSMMSFSSVPCLHRIDKGEKGGKDIFCSCDDATVGVTAWMLYSDLIVFPMFSESFHKHHYMPL